MTKQRRVAPPRSRDELEEMAWQARADMGLMPFERVPVARLLENVVPLLIGDFHIRVVERGKLGRAEAVTDSVKPFITFDEDTYNGLYRDQPRPRMTGAHELAHLLLHTGQTGFAFLRKRDQRVDVEWQADVFAAAFLMPECAFRQVKSIEEAMKRFGVSRDAACCRARNLKMHWLVSAKPAPRRTKKKGHGKSRAP